MTRVEWPAIAVIALGACGAQPPLPAPTSKCPEPAPPALTASASARSQDSETEPLEPAASATVVPEGFEADPPPPADSASAVDPTCRNDPNEPDDEPSINQRAGWASLGIKPPTSFVACPGDTDHIQGEGDFSMNASVRWNPQHGDLSVTLVHLDGTPYVLRNAPYNRGESMKIEPGRWTVVGGTYSHFIRVRNRGAQPIPYQVEVVGIWGE